MASEACAMQFKEQCSVSFPLQGGKMEFKYTRNNHSVGDSIVHMELCHKYRYNVVKKEEY